MGNSSHSDQYQLLTDNGNNGKIARERRNMKPSKGNSNSNQKGKKKEEKDPDAMDIDGMSAGE